MRVGLAEVQGVSHTQHDGSYGTSGESVETDGLLVKVFDVGTHPVLVSVKGTAIAISLDEAAEIIAAVLHHPDGLRNRAVYDLLFEAVDA